MRVMKAEGDGAGRARFLLRGTHSVPDRTESSADVYAGRWMVSGEW